MRHDGAAQMGPDGRKKAGCRRSLKTPPLSRASHCCIGVHPDRNRPCRVRRAFVPQDDLLGLIVRRRRQPLGSVQPPSGEYRLHCLRQNELQRATRSRRRIRPVRRRSSFRERNRRSEANKENKQTRKQKNRAAGSRSHEFAHLLGASTSTAGSVPTDQMMSKRYANDNELILLLICLK